MQFPANCAKTGTHRKAAYTEENKEQRHLFRKLGALARSSPPVAVSADSVCFHRAGFHEAPVLRGPVAQESRSAHCLIHAENPRALVALALSASGHPHPAAARAKAVPAAAEVDQQWVTGDQVVQEEEVVGVVAAEEVVVEGVDTRRQSHSTGTHSSNSR